MEQKYYLIIGIIAILIVIVVGIIMVNPFSNLPQNSIEGLESRRAIFDTAIIEATVLSVKQGGVERPDDFGQIRIDSISNYVRNLEANYEPLHRSIISTEISIKFASSARPAKIRCEQIPSVEPVGETILPRTEETESPATEPEGSITQTIPFEDGYFIYTYYTGTCPEEIILPGISEGNRIKFPISYAGTFPNVGEYEIIP